MDLTDFSDKAAKNNMESLLEDFPYLVIRYGELDKFSGAAIREPQLESSYDAGSEKGQGVFDVVSLYYKDAFLGTTSFFLERNKVKKEEADHFARIDIVVVEPDFRQKGAGKVLVLAAIQYMLDRWGSKIYSISSLAAHEAIARILEEVNFQGEQKASEKFKRETISFNEVSKEAFTSRVSTKLAEAIRLTNYRLRSDES